MTTRKITLINTYHNTTVGMLVHDDGILSKRQVRKAWTRLCGIDGCTCGGSAGQRPIGQITPL